MSVRRDTKNRLTLYRECHTCGLEIVTTADTPFVRQLHNVAGQKQKTCYFCPESCWRASYKRPGWRDGLAGARRRAKEAARDKKEKNRRYYDTHAEQERQRARERYWSDPESARADNRYQREKRRILSEAV